MTTYAFEKYTDGLLVERDVVDTAAATFTVFNGAGQQQSQRALTPAEVTQYAASNAAGIVIVNQATIVANIQTHLGQLEAFLVANPNGAVLTAAQTAILARMLIGVGRLLIGLTTTVGQAT